MKKLTQSNTVQLIALLVTALLLHGSCKKEENKIVETTTAKITNDKWTKVSNASLGGEGVDYVTSNDSGILYMSTKSFYSIDSNFKVSNSYNFIDYPNSLHNEFFNQRLVHPIKQQYNK